MEESEKGYSSEDLPKVLGKLSLEERAKKFKEVGDKKTVKQITKQVDSFSQGLGFSFGREERPCEDTEHAFGFIPATKPGGDNLIQIEHPGNITSDQFLKASRVKITLDVLGAYDYPGKGEHLVLFDFYTKNQLPDKQAEELHFNQTFRVHEGQTAGMINYPVFVGLNIGQNGLGLRCYTVNVKNKDDERVLNFLDSGVFKSGLTLATTAQPAIAPLADLALGVTKMIASRHKNVPVQDIYMGLDYTDIVTGARLAQGSYVAVQISQKDKETWNWKKWVYDRNAGSIVNKETNKRIEHNYVIISISKYEES